MQCIMEGQITVRLPKRLRKALDDAARREKRRPTELVRLALEAYLGPASNGPSRRAERVANLIGSLASGIPDLAERHR